MLNKILFRNQDKKQLIIAMIGSFFGITFLVTSIHYLIRVSEFGEGNDILGPNTIIASKKVTDANILGLAKTDFDPEELVEIRKLSFIEEVKPVISNNFDVYFETKDEKLPVPFGTDVFIQSVDTAFLDVKASNWDWQEGDESVPIIMPRDFIVMLNTFASAQGIGQVSEDLAKKIRFKLSVSTEDRKKREAHYAHIIGFTSSVSAILVPESFMEYGNANFSDGSEQKITQIMISGKEGQFGKVEAYMTENGLESRESQMAIGRLKSIIGTLFLVVLGISVIAVFVSGLVLIQYMQLLITRNVYEVRTLIRIGYHPNEIIKKFFMYFMIIFGIVLAVGLTSFLILKVFLDGMFESGGIYIGTEMTMWSFGALILAYFLFTLSSFLTARKGIYHEY